MKRIFIGKHTHCVWIQAFYMIFLHQSCGSLIWVQVEHTITIRIYLTKIKLQYTQRTLLFTKAEDTPNCCLLLNNLRAEYTLYSTESWIYTGCFTTLGHNCRRWFPRSLWWKISYKHVSDFGRLRSYDRLKLRIKGNDYWQ